MDYTIKKGDTLGALAKTYGTDVNTLAKLNNISNVNLIQEGSTLKLPGGGTVPAVPSATATQGLPSTLTSTNIKPGAQIPNIPTIAPAPTGTPVPTNTPSALASTNVADQIIKATQVEDTQAQKTATDLSSTIYNLLPKLAGESADTSAALNSAGVGQLKADLQNINSQIIKKQAEISQDDITLIANMRAEERRDTLLPFAQSGQAKIAGDAAILRALKTSEIGVLNASAIAKQGDIELAVETAKDAVAAKYAPYKEAINIYQAQLEALAPILSKDEAKQAAQQKLRGDLAMKEIDRAQANDDNAKALALKLQANGAPQSIITKALTAKSIAEIQALPGVSNYLLSKADRLELAIKGEQLTKIKNENKGGDGLLSVDDATKLGVPYGTTKAEAIASGKMTGGTQKVNERLALQDKITGIDKLKDNSGLRGVVGPNKFARAGLFDFNTFTGTEGDFIAGVNQLTNQETLDALLNLKRAGGTLGALSEGEGKLLREAATKINSWALKDSNGNVYGYKTSQKSFKEELDSLKTLSQRALVRAGGPVETADENLNGYLDTVSGALQNTNNAYSQAGYDLN